MSAQVTVENKSSKVLRLRKVRVVCSECPAPISPWMKGNAGARTAAKLVKLHKAQHRGAPQRPEQFNKNSKVF